MNLKIFEKLAKIFRQLQFMSVPSANKSEIKKYNTGKNRYRAKISGILIYGSFMGINYGVCPLIMVDNDLLLEVHVE